MRIIFLFVSIFLSLSVYSIIKLPFNPQGFTINYIDGYVQNALTILMVLLFMKKYDKRTIQSAGLRIDFKEGLIKFLKGVLLATVSIGSIIILSILSGFTKFEGFGTVTYGIRNVCYSLFLGLILCIFVGFGEEILCRGYIQTNISERYGKKIGLILSSIIFTALHIGTYSHILDFGDIFLAGLILGYLYIITGSLFMSIGYHFFEDFLQISIFRIEAPVTPSYQIFRFKIPDNVYINGYNLGCKMEIYFVAVELIILTLLIYFHKYKTKGN